MTIGKIDCIEEIYEIIPKEIYEKLVINKLYDLYIGNPRELDIWDILDFYNNLELEYNIDIYHEYIDDSSYIIMNILMKYHRVFTINNIIF